MFFNIFQLIVPILLIIGLTIQFIKLVMNPDEKGGGKKKKVIVIFGYCGLNYAGLQR